MDRRRLADIRTGTADKVQSSGSGYLVGDHLVLSAWHVIADPRGIVRPLIKISVGHPSDGQRQCTAIVSWHDPKSDLVLLRIDAENGKMRSVVRWGCFIGSEPCRYEGLGFPQFSDYESGRGVEQLGGYLPPLAVGENSCYVLDQSAAPEMTVDREWGGASGAAIFCKNLLVGIVAKDDRSFANRRLHATRIAQTFSNPEFMRLIEEDSGSRPVLEAVELSDYLRPPLRPMVAKTPGMILAPDLEAVNFTGREQVLENLSRWRDSDAVFSVALVVGEGGSGKTRLAREFALRAAGNGWIAGFAGVSATGGNGDRNNAWEGIRKSLRASTRPIVIIADYAETHPDYITALTEDLRSDPPASPVRLLLLARGVGGWWENLSNMLSGEDARLIALPPLTDGVSEREKAYTTAVHDLAHYLALLAVEPSADDLPGDWRSRAARLADNLPDLSNPRFGNALTLHIAALNDLLAMGALRNLRRSPGSQEQELVRHEAGYLRRAAARRGLFERDVLSPVTDPDDRKREIWGLLERSLAGLILLGPADNQRGHAIAGLCSRDRARDIVAWLSALYPPPVGYDGVGTMQPDRLAEFFLGDILTRDSALLDRIAALVDSLDKAVAFIFTILRVSSHPQFAAVGEQARDLIQERPDPFAEAALILTVNLAHAASAQGIAAAVSVLEAVLQQAQSLSPPDRPGSLAAAIRMAAARLAQLRGEIGSESVYHQAGDAVPAPRIPAGSSSSEIYLELAKSGAEFLSTLLDVALDVIGISVTKSVDEDARSVPIPEVAQNSLISEITEDPWPAEARQMVWELYQSEYKSLVRLANLLVHDMPTAEEVVQDSFEAMTSAWRRLRDSEKALSYLRQAVVNRSRSVLRHRTIVEKNTPKPAPDVPSAEEGALAQLERSEVVRALRSLPERQREALVLRYYADLSDTEIAATMGITMGATQSHLRRGITALRKVLDAEAQ